MNHDSVAFILSACDDLYRHAVGFVAGIHGCYVRVAMHLCGRWLFLLVAR